MSHPSSILSTHSGHHRIFIGPVIQKTNGHANVQDIQLKHPTTDSPPHNHTRPHHHHGPSASTPKPWWEQGSSFLRSHLSLHHTSTDSPPTSTSTAHPPSSSSTAPSSLTNPAPSQGASSPSPPVKQTAIPQISYTFSDDEDSTASEDYDDEGAYDSEDEQKDYAHDHDETHSDRDDDHYLDQVNLPYSSSVESYSARVGVGHVKESSEESGQMRPAPPPPAAEPKGKERAVDDSTPRTSKEVVRGPSSREKKRTKSMRDEGEPNRVKKLFGTFREKRRNQGRIDNPDLEWESDGSRASRPRYGRQMTSGALTHGHDHDHTSGGNQHVLMSSPMSSELDLPATDPENRPALCPIQPADGNGPSPSDRLSPGGWNPSTSSLSSGSSPQRTNIQRGSTWMTAREYASSIGNSSLYQQAIEEENEPEDEEARHSLDKVITHDSLQLSQTGESSKSVKTNDQGLEKSVENLAIKDEGESSSAASASKEPLTSTISKASSRFGRALLNRAPTGLKKADDGKNKSRDLSKDNQGPSPSLCSLDKECQKTHEDHSNKKHVRFLTKVQYQIASSRQPTQLTTHPIVRQGRMLVRKEVTERPGPHVYNSDTARKLERQSQGWKEWWCVMKGPPTGVKPKVTKIRRKKKGKDQVEKGRLEFYYNHKKIKGTVVFSSRTSVSVYSSLDYSIAVTQNYPDAIGLTVYILRPRTISLACAWYMEIYTLLNGAAPIPSFIDIAVPDFDVKIRVPIPEDSDSETDSADSSLDENEGDHQEEILARSVALSNTRPKSTGTAPVSSMDSEASSSPSFTQQEVDQYESFRTARTSLPVRLASKSFYLTNDNAKPTLVSPDEVTPKLLRSHVLSLLKDVPDWTEVVKMWQDPRQHGDVALCWKRYDRMEWIYWTDQVLAETDSDHLKKDHIGFADGSDWSGNMDSTVVGPQVLDKTHKLELRPITHYPTKAMAPDGEELHEPDPIEGYLVRVSAFSGNPIRRFRRLYLTSHDHMLIYTIPSEAHSPSMHHAGSIDPTALMFCISPHRSANPDHKDMAQSRAIRRLKAQVRAAKGFIDMTQIEDVRVMTVQEWNEVRHMSSKKQKKKRRELFAEMTKKAKELAAESRAIRAGERHQHQQEQQQPVEMTVATEGDNYFFPHIKSNPAPGHEDDEQFKTQSPEPVQEQAPQVQPLQDPNGGNAHVPGSVPEGFVDGSLPSPKRKGTLKNGIVRSATVVADLLLNNTSGIQPEDGSENSNVIEIEMKDGTCVRFRAFNAQAATLWRDQLEKLAKYWRLRKRLDIKAHMQVYQANNQLASSLDDDEIQVGEVIQEWDNDRAMVNPEIWNWCVVNGCRSVTKSGVLYYKPRLHSTFRKMYLVLTEGYLMLFHPHRRSKASGQVIPTSTCKLFGIHALTDIYIYSGHFSDEDTSHGTNDESERLPRYYPDGLIVDDPDEDCTFSIWRGKRRRMFSRRGTVARTAMSSRSLEGNSRVFGSGGLLSSLVKDGVVYGSSSQSCTVLRARSRSDLEEWVHALNTEIERCVRAERRRMRGGRQ